MSGVFDLRGRQLRELRISVTDRCNYRCSYCMPHDRYEWINRHEILTFEEIARVAGIFVRLGGDEIRLTGGEPLLRHDLERLVEQLIPLGLKDLSLTTNGSMLAEKARALAQAGLRRINVSLDTLDSQKFRRITRRDDLVKVLQGLDVARDEGLAPIKLNCVIERGLNHDEILPLLEFSRSKDFAIRFIEYMDVGNVNRWQSERTVSKREILETIRSRYELREVGRSDCSSPAVDFELADGTLSVGIIASVTEPFCGGCTRARLTADGRIVLCLFSEGGVDVKRLLRGGAKDDEISELLRSTWGARQDRYSEERLVAMNSTQGYDPGSRRKIEMISLGG